MSLLNFIFSDLYLGERVSLFGRIPNYPHPSLVPTELNDELKTLRERCQQGASKHPGANEFPIHSDCGMAFRVSVLPAKTETVYVLRKIPDKLLQFDALGIPTPYMDLLMTPNMSGLVLIAGSYAEGKTTTASAVTVERLKRLGGVAVTVEDPPELPIEGRHGDGVCYQTEVGKGTFGESLRKVARWAPTIIYLGEVRDYEAATEAIRAAINGVLVICTCHGENLIAAIERLYTLGASGAVNPEDVSSLLSSALKIVMCQQMTIDLNGEKRIKCQFLWFDEGANGLRAKVHDRQFRHLASDIEAQLNRTIRQRPTKVG